MLFRLHSDDKSTGDQPGAIEVLARGVENGLQEQTLLGVTGSGRTFTMANVIQKVQRPALVLSHNKTLAGQLFEEFKEFFPENAVEYFGPAAATTRTLTITMTRNSTGSKKH